MSNPICVQVNLFHRIDDFIGGESDMDTEDALSYVSEYVYCLSSEFIASEGGEDAEEFRYVLLDGMPMIAEFHQLAFKNALAEWADLHGKSVEEMVRGYVDNGWGSFQMVHGCGYAWMSSDLFGGASDGRAEKEFEKWAEEELNLRFVF